jgi:predicted kinase
MIQRLILTRGLPASGKSTWATNFIDENSDTVRIERDLLRDQLFATRYNLTSDQEKMIAEVQFAMAKAAVKAGRSIVVSDMNLRAQYVRQWAKFAAENSLEFSTIKFDNVPLDELIKRDNSRDNSVGESVIRMLWDKFTRNGKVAEVDVSKELNNRLVIEPYEKQPELPTAILVDIDGTLAKMNGRSPYEWNRVGEDEPVQAVIDAVQAAAAMGDFIIVMSGRDGSCRGITEDWLNANLGDYWDYLYMRVEGDGRKDDIVKLELFNKYVRDVYDVRYVLDDRRQVVVMWRALGLACFQVADGDF